MDLPAREESLTFLELRRFCEVCYDHIMLRSSNLADPTTVLALDRKAPDESRLCWGAPLFESDVEAVTMFLPDFEGDPRREFLPVCRAGRKEAVRAIVQFFFHFKYYEKSLGPERSTVCLVPSSIGMNRPPVYGLYSVLYNLKRTGLMVLRVTRISLTLNVRIVSQQKQISVAKVFILSQSSESLVTNPVLLPWHLKPHVRQIRRKLRKEKKRRRKKC